jgi:hypothetical protein
MSEISKEIQDGLDALEASVTEITPVGALFHVTYRKPGTDTIMTPPTELVRAKFLIDPRYDAVSVTIPETGTYEVTVLYPQSEQ